jgi:CBS-domain-containing membrane protein
MLTPTVPTPAVPPAASRAGPRSAPPSATGTMRRFPGRSLAASADSVWVPLASAALVLVAGAMALATGAPWLFAALGPTAVLMAANPGHPTTRFHTVVLGHLTALLCAWLAVLLMGAGATPNLFGGHAISVARIWASAAAIAVTTLVQPSLKAYHPPSAATALLITLGAYGASWKNLGSMVGGVLVVALVGEWLQRVRLAETKRAGAAA